MNKKQNKAMRNCAAADNSAEAHQSGFVLIAVMIFAALGSVLATTMLYGTGSQIIRTTGEIRYEKAFFIAEAGVERTKADLRSASSALNSALTNGAPSFGASTVFGGGTYQIGIADDNESDANPLADTNRTVIIRSTGTYENVSRALEVAVRVEARDFPPPNADGAVGVYGTNTTITLGGSSIIDGRDYSLPANFDANGGSVAGTVTTNHAVPGVFASNSISMTGTNRITGDIITNGTSQLGTNYWQDQTDALIPQAAITLTGGTYSATTDLGTRTNPKITVVTGDTTLTSNLDGAGILIARDSVDLIFSGNFHYEGVVILMGNNIFTVTGTARLFGALVTTSEGVNISINGNPEILYSSAALANLRNLQMNPCPLSVVYWRETR